MIRLKVINLLQKVIAMRSAQNTLKQDPTEANRIRALQLQMEIDIETTELLKKLTN